VDIDFKDIVNSSMTSEYTVYLKYTILDGICSNALGQQQVELDWAHRWADTVVTESRYEIEFVEPGTKPSMNSVCFGSTGLPVRCGSFHLDINGNLAVHQVSHGLHGAFFTWPSQRKNAAGRQCTASQQLDVVSATSATAGSDVGKQTENSDLRQEAEKHPIGVIVAVFAVIITLLGVCIFLGVAGCCTSRRSKKRSEKGSGKNACASGNEASVIADEPVGGSKILLGRTPSKLLIDGKEELCTVSKSQAPSGKNCDSAATILPVDLEQGLIESSPGSSDAIKLEFETASKSTRSVFFAEPTGGDSVPIEELQEASAPLGSDAGKSMLML